ncbi:MAG: hypothetical protein RIC55_31900 [Pirellulaceae bacterium]
MADLIIGVLLITAFSIAVFFAAAWSARRLPPWAASCIAAVVILAMVAYTHYLWYDVALVRFLPFSNLIVIGNWYPLMAGLLAGVVFASVKTNWLRRGAVLAALFAVGGYAMVAPLLGRPPECGNRWTNDGICLQTTDKTCTAACAATLLTMHGIDANEQEMAGLCLTREGTTWMGLYRGLKMKTAGTAWDVEVVACSPEELMTKKPGPMVLMVGIEAGSDSSRIMRREEGWIPGVGHSVVLLDTAGSRGVVVADPTPSIGRETWTARDFQQLWRFCGMRLVRRA